MKRILPILAGLSPIILATIISWFIYRNVPTTPVLVLILILIFAAVVLGFGFYRRVKIKSDGTEALIDIDYPELEDALIYVQAPDFCSKIELNEGNLFLVGSEMLAFPTKLKDAKYKKLTDTTIIEFKDQLTLEINGLNTIGVGDYQFCFFGFSSLKVYKSNQLSYYYSWNSSNLTLIKEGKELELFTPDGVPILHFSWGNSEWED